MQNEILYKSISSIFEYIIAKRLKINTKILSVSHKRYL